MARTRHLKITVEGKVYDVVVEDVTDDDGTLYPSPGLATAAAQPPTASSVPDRAASAPAASHAEPGTPPVVAGANEKLAPMGGVVIEISVKEGDTVEAGRQLLTMEAMKMKQMVAAHKDGVITKIHVQAGEAIDAGQPLVTIE